MGNSDANGGVGMSSIRGRASSSGEPSHAPRSP